MPIKRFAGTFRSRTDVLDNITPNNKVQANVSVPAGEWKPAAWLPIQWTETASLDNFVIASGKVVALDAEGRVAPAGLKVAWAAITASGQAAVTYNAADVAAGVIDLSTGQAVVAAGALTATVAAIGLVSRGLVDENNITPAGGVGLFLGSGAQQLTDELAVLDLFISHPVGVAAYNVYCWAGETPDSLNFVNYQKQHLVQFLTDIQMKVPHLSTVGVVSAAVDTGTLGATWTAGTGTAPEAWPDADVAAGELFIDQANIHLLQRYINDIPTTPPVGQGVIAVALTGPGALAQDTPRTPVASSAGTLVRRRPSALAVQGGVAGDWYLDAEVGLLFVNDSANAGTVSPFAGAETVSYSVYDSGVATNGRFVHLTTPGASQSVRPGDFVTFDANSDFAVLNGGVVAGTNMATVVGRVLATQLEPAGLLDRVRTAWNQAGFAADAQMPGTATGGFSDLLTLTSGAASNKIAVINVKIQ